MNILMTQRISQNAHGVPIDSLESDYVRFFSSLGLRCFPISNFCPDISFYTSQLEIQAVVLTGGNDIQEDNDYIQYRNATAAALLRWALKQRTPVLGICRGMQFLNVYFGGKLITIKDKYGGGAHLPGKDHSLHITGNKWLFGSEAMVNSFHNQGLTEKELSSHLRAFAVSDEGIVEGFHHTSLPIVGVQWHPERESPDEEFNDKLVKAFVEKELWWKKK